MSRLEHTNLTVTDPDATAAMLCEIFDWHIRWSGAALAGGYTVHVGSEEDYLALYTFTGVKDRDTQNQQAGNLNHVGILVDDLEAVERRILEAGCKTFNHGDYEPGRRFYFLDGDSVEYEVVSYKG
jgi:glyoxylase I family protein